MTVQDEIEFPVGVVDRLSARNVARLHRWWSRLETTERRSFVEAWAADDTIASEHDPALTVLLEPRFIDAGSREVQEDRNEDRVARRALLDWVVAHPEYRWGLAERSFHICRAHRHARDTVRVGFIPANFRCPLKRRRCPMRRLLEEKPGHDVALSVVALHSAEGRS